MKKTKKESELVRAYRKKYGSGPNAILALHSLVRALKHQVS
jgi:hypothetical protein